MSEALPSEESLRDALAACGADLRPGLSDAEFDRVESEFDFRFAPDHRRLLSVALPVGDAWPDWRGGDRLELRERLDWPVRGILFDVQRNRFWHPEWEARPAETAEALSVARERLVKPRRWRFCTDTDTCQRSRTRRGIRSCRCTRRTSSTTATTCWTGWSMSSSERHRR